MAEAKKRLLTYAGLKAIEDELENLKVVKRKEVAGKIKEAREQGDLSENAEYDAARRAAALLPPLRRGNIMQPKEPGILENDAQCRRDNIKRTTLAGKYTTGGAVLFCACTLVLRGAVLRRVFENVPRLAVQQ